MTHTSGPWVYDEFTSEADQLCTLLLDSVIYEDGDEGYGGGYCFDCDARGVLAEALARRAPQWIPVGERLPGDYERIQLYTTDDDRWIAYCVGEYWFEHATGDCIGDLTYGTHWQALPPPPTLED